MSGTLSFSKALKVFYSYARRDKKLRDELAKHLSGLQRQGIIMGWHEGEIKPGSVRDVVLQKELTLADIILLLISPDFIASDYCYCLEMTQALERHERGETYIIPILLRSVAIQGLPFAFLQFLPEDGKPIAKQRDKDDAFAKIAEALRNVITEIGEKLSSEPAPSREKQASLMWWKVPYARNPFFTGRVAILEQLHTAFMNRQESGCVQTLNGLGGIGKTQIALEYVYRYAQIYQAIFWVAADPQGDLLADFVSIARFLRLPEQDEADQALIVAAIKNWFQEHEGWLLVYDNVEEVAEVKQFLPAARKGHILITTRAQATGTLAAPCEVEPMHLQEGTLFLLQRIKLLSADMPLDQVDRQEYAAAEGITRLFAGHPLALDQAGAYVEETGQGLADYLGLYRQRQATLLARRGESSIDHLDSVTTTFSLAFERVERLRPDAAELLRFSAFFHPDALPEELLLAGAQSLAPAYQGITYDAYELDALLVVLRKFSLVRRNPATRTVSMHRLVQEVLKHSMSPEQQRRWAELAVQVLSREFPDGEPASWPTCLRYLPHARVGLDLIDMWQMRFIKAARLLNQVGHYLYKRAEYAEAQQCYEKALELLAEKKEHLLAAQVFSNLGVLHIYLAHPSQAESYLKRALSIREQMLEPAHPDLAQNINDLAGVYHNQGKLAEAESLYEQALAMQEQTLGVDNPVTASTLSNLALLKYGQKMYAESEQLNKRALMAREKHLGDKHADTGQSLLNLAYVYLLQEHYGEAEPLFTRALAIYEEVYGSEHPHTGIALNGLGRFYHAQQLYGEAEPLFTRALAIWENVYGEGYPRLVGLLKVLAEIFFYREQYEDAERLLRRAGQIQEQTSWLEYIDLVPNFRELLRIYESQEKYDQAEALYQFMITHCQRVLGEGHLEVQTVQEEYLAFLHKKGKNEMNESPNGY